MKKLIILFISIIFFSCNKSQEIEINTNYEHTKGIWFDMEYSINEKIIDSCEYIIIFGQHSRNIIHKANCKNKFHYKL